MKLFNHIALLFQDLLTNIPENVFKLIKNASKKSCSIDPIPT